MTYRITALKTQKHNTQRVNIYLDDSFAFGLARIVAAWLKVGQEISEDQIARMQDEDDRETAYQRAIKYINYRPHSENEIRRFLMTRIISKDNIEPVIERLKHVELINDSRFAKDWVENRSDFRPRSKRALAYELKRRGIRQDIIDSTLEYIDETKLAYKAAHKQARKIGTTNWKFFRKKMFGHLARRGFNYVTCAQVVEQIWAEQNNTNQENSERIY
ncbi:regulatory protein RecX [Chloroflexota bacterium]